MKKNGLLSLVVLGTFAGFSAGYDLDYVRSSARELQEVSPVATPTPRRNRPRRNEQRLPAPTSTNSIPEKDDEVLFTTAVETGDGAGPGQTSSPKKAGSNSRKPRGTVEPKAINIRPVSERQEVQSTASPSTPAVNSSSSPPSLRRGQDVEGENDETHGQPLASPPGFIGETEKNVNAAPASNSTVAPTTTNAKGTNVAMEDRHRKRRLTNSSPPRTNRTRKKSAKQ